MSQNSYYPYKVASLDEILGIRGRWVILYGALPSSISFLGVKVLKDVKFTNTLEFYLLVSIILITPFIITFVHIRANCRLWYLNRYLLTFRSVVLTISILLLATIFSLVSDLLLQFSEDTADVLHWEAISSGLPRALIIGIASMTISSAFISGMLVSKKYYYGLPSNSFEDSIKELRISLTKVVYHKLFEIKLDDRVESNDEEQKDDPKNDLEEPLEEFIQNTETSINLMKGFIGDGVNSGFEEISLDRKRYEQLLKGLECSKKEALKLLTSIAGRNNNYCRNELKGFLLQEIKNGRKVDPQIGNDLKEIAAIKYLYKGINYSD